MQVRSKRSATLSLEATKIAFKCIWGAGTSCSQSGCRWRGSGFCSLNFNLKNKNKLAVLLLK